MSVVDVEPIGDCVSDRLEGTDEVVVVEASGGGATGQGHDERGRVGACVAVSCEKRPRDSEFFGLDSGRAATPVFAGVLTAFGA
jgi:hypothetical protein